MSRKFHESESYDHKIIDVDDDGKSNKVGEIRVKPNRIMWKAKGSQTWKGVSLNDFAEWMEANGKEQEK